MLLLHRYTDIVKNETAFLDYLQKTLQKIKKENKTVFIPGDFNYNLLNSGNDSNIDMFLELMYTNVLQPHIIYPTRIVDNANPTLIDNIFSNCVDCNITCGKLIEKISDHLPNFLIIPNYKNSELKNKYYKRDYSQFNEDLYLRNFLNDDILGSLINSDDTSNKYDIFHEHLITTLNRYH